MAMAITTTTTPTTTNSTDSSGEMDRKQLQLMQEDTEMGNSKELRREEHFPHYLPRKGTGRDAVDGAGNQGTILSRATSPLHGTAPAPATTTTSAPSLVNDVAIPTAASTVARPSYFPPYASSASQTSSLAPPFNRQETSGSSNFAAHSSPSGINTPGTSFGYSPDEATGNMSSPDWLPSPVSEKRDDDVPIRSIDQLTLGDMRVVQNQNSNPRGRSTNIVPRTASNDELVSLTKGEKHISDPLAENEFTPKASITPTIPKGPIPSPTRQRAGSASTAPAAALPASIPTVRPPAPEHKKSMFGKLFHHKDKSESSNKEKESHGHHFPEALAGRSSPIPPSAHQESGLSSTRPGYNTRTRDSRSQSTSKTRERGYSSASNTPYASGAESDSSSRPVRSISTHAGQDSEAGAKRSNFLGRRSSNKKMETPDPTLMAMAHGNINNSTASAASSSTLDLNPSASTITQTGGVNPMASVNYNTAGLLNPNDLSSSTTASRTSTPEVQSASRPVAQQRNSSASPARPPEHSVTNGASWASKSMIRRSSEKGHDGSSGPAATVNGKHHPSGTSTPVTGEQHQVKEKSLKEHLAALGTSAGMGKLTRKTSQNGSRRSDDGKSEKSEGSTNAAVPALPQPKRAPSASGVSNASSLLQKYGVCEKIAIGKGATAVVRLAHKWDRSTEKLYAVKEFRKRRKNETEKEYVKKLTSEFCISSTLHHVNVVETVDLVQNEEKHWCEVMEYCPGGDLYAAIKKGDMSNDLVNIYFKQIITGVAYLHSMGVAHRDIKPENLLLDNQGHVKITDFGVSDVFRMCWEKQTHMSKGLCGSEPYIAPEQFEQKEYDARLVDVWACAVVFYCMQAQELPWRVAKSSDPSFAEFVTYYNSSSPPPLGNLHPKDCRAIVKKMLDPNPKTRLGMDAVLADSFMKAIKYTATPTAPTPLT